MPRRPLVLPAFLVVLALALLPSMVASAASNDGVLDQGFGTNGIVSENISTYFPTVYAQVAAQADGKVVISGTADSSEATWTSAIDRLLPDGSLDPTFGTNGRVSLDVRPGEYEYPSDLMIGANGDIYLLTGYPGDGLMVALDANGAAKAGFGTSGIARHLDVAEDELNAFDLAADGSILVVGRTNTGNNQSPPYYSIAVWKYTSAGVLDQTFGTAGMTRVDFNDSSEAVDVEVLTNGSIMVLAKTLSGNGFEWSTVLTKLTPAGALDTTFDTDGIVTPDFGGSNLQDEPVRLHVTGGGEMLVAATLENANGGNDLAIARLTAAGALDTTFDTDGINTHGPGGGTRNYQVRALDVLADGTIIVAGANGGPFASSATASMVAFNASTGAAIGGFGALDGDAEVPAAITQPISRYFDIAVTGSGASERITAVGQLATDSGLDGVGRGFAVRTSTSGQFDTGFDGDGFLSRPLGEGTSAPEQLLIAHELSDGRIIAAGLELDATQYVIRLSMHLANGALDTSWGSNGYVVDSSGVGLPMTALLDDQDRLVLLAMGQNQVPNIRRYLADGSVDPGFGVSGFAQRPAGFRTVSPGAQGIILDGAGGLIVGGTTGSGVSVDFAVYRLTSNGVIDTLFGVNGMATINNQVGDYTLTLGLDSTGRILVGGASTSNLTAFQYTLARLTSGGALDPSFGTAGVVSGTLSGAGSVYANAVAVDSQDRVLVGMSHVVNNVAKFVIQRRLSDGTLDADFTQIEIPTALEEGLWPGMALDQNGRILALTHAESAGSFVPDISIVGMFSPDGVPVSTFGSSGQLRFDDYLMASMVRDSGGRFLVAGSRGQVEMKSYEYDRAIARVLADPTPVSAPQNDSTTTTTATVTTTTVPVAGNRTVMRELPRTGARRLSDPAMALLVLGGLTVLVSRGLQGRKRSL